MNSSSQTVPHLSLRAQFRAATREAILEAAAELMSAGGAHTRIEDIAALAGVAVGTVYNYFEDRAALVSALLEARTRTLLNTLDQVPSAAKAPAAAAGSTRVRAAFESELVHFVSALVAHFDANRFLFDLLVEEGRQRGIDVQAATRRRTVLGDLLVRAEALMAKGIRSRVLQKETPALYAALLVGMVRGVALSALNRQSPFSTHGAASIVRVFLEGARR